MRLEKHIHGVCHLDYFTVHQAEAFVVIEHRVHVFNPLGVDRAVEHDPSALHVRLRVRTVAEDRAKHTVRELLRNRIVVAIKLG